MRDKKILMLTAILVFISGCICCGNFPDSKTTSTLPESGTEGGLCNAPYIQVGSGCCLDQNNNGICDRDEMTEPPKTEGPQEESTTTTLKTTCTLDSDCIPCGEGCIGPGADGSVSATCLSGGNIVCRCINGNCVAETVTTTTIATTTTTTLSNEPNCYDGVKNQNEDIIDCGGACSSECMVTTLGGWQQFFGYRFRLKRADFSSNVAKYTVNIRTPDGKDDERLVTTGESFVDHLRFKVIDYGEQSPRFYIKINKADLQRVYAVSPNATLLTVGGHTCQEGILWRKSAEGELCTRVYGRFNITGSRTENGVELVIIKDDGLFTGEPLILKDSQTGMFDDIKIGVIADREHYIVGGYTLIYVYPKNA